MPSGPRESDPAKMTSCMAPPRRCLADCSPMHQRMASTMLDLPQPLGPTTAVMGSAGAEEPVLHVKARTRIDLTSVVRVAGGVLLKGALVDTALEEPIPGRTVAIAVDGPNGFYRYAEPTSDDGTFRWRVPLPLG